MEKIARNAPTLAVFIALIIQVERVKDFGERINAGWLSWVFAIFLAGTIFVLSYWNGRLKYTITASEDDRRAYAQQKRVKQSFDSARKATILWLTLFVFIDGALNLAETMSSLPLDVEFWEQVGAGVYGVFPTLAAFGLGTFQAVIDKIPTAPTQKSALRRMLDAWMRRMETQADAVASQPVASANAQTQDAPQDAKDANAQTQNAPQADAYPKACPHGCGASLKNASQYSAHVGRWCEVLRKKNALNAQEPITVDVDVEKVTA